MSHQFQHILSPDYQLKCELGLADIIGHGLIWILLSFITFGLALFVFPYYLMRFTIGKTVIYQQEVKIGRLECTIDFASILGNVVIWAIISVLTLGIGYLIFIYKINAHCLNQTKVIKLNPI